MPAADRSTGPARGPKTICIPCSQQEYERVVDDPERVPRVPGPADRGHARIVPAGDPPGLPHEGHLHLPQDRLEAPPDRTPQPTSATLVRPSFLMPYLSGRTEDVQAPLFSASSPSRSGP